MMLLTHDHRAYFHAVLSETVADSAHPGVAATSMVRPL
jgi:hypothetical protein